MCEAKRPWRAFLTNIPDCGPHEDFGIKYNCENGGPAPESMTDAIYKDTRTISSYKICKGIPDIDLSKEGIHQFDGFTIEVCGVVLWANTVVPDFLLLIEI